MDHLNVIIGHPPGIRLEYKTVMPTSRNLARHISAFANTQGGYIILGVQNDVDDSIKVVGLSEDFHVNTIVHKAIDLLSVKPMVEYQYITYAEKKIYVIKIEHSEEAVNLEGKTYVRKDAATVQKEEDEVFVFKGYRRIKDINEKLEEYKTATSEAKRKLIEHYQSVLKIMDDLGENLYPDGTEKPTENIEGKILSRILYGSFVDNFETYLSNLIYEIYLAKPETLKSDQSVTVREVLECADLQDFVIYVAKQKISKLQKGSVKGFIKDTKQIRDLNAIDKEEQDYIEKILQIRHLYTHRNGIVDEKFLQHFREGYELNIEHKMSVSEMCDKLEYLANIVNKVDLIAIDKYKLGS